MSKCFNKVKRKFKEILNPCDLREAMNPLLMMHLVSGLLPFRLAGPKGQRYFKVTYFGYISCIVQIVMFTVCYALTVTGKNIFISFILNLPLSHIMDLLLVTIAFVAIIVTYVWCFIKRDSIIKAINLIVDIDVKLLKLGVNEPYRRTLIVIIRFWALSWLVFGAYVIGSYVLLDLFEHSTDSHVWVSYFLPHLYLLHMVFEFLAVNGLIKNRLEKVNMVR